jgi:hypothetical protein
MDRTVTPPRRRAGTGTLLTCAVAVASVLLAAGCSSDSGTTSDPTQSPAAAPTPEPVRFSTLPNACATLDKKTIGEVVPEAGNAKGEELPSSDVDATGTCLWSGLDGYDFRSLTVTLKRFESDLSLGSGDERAGEFVTYLAAEVTEDEANKDVAEEAVEDLGDEAVTLAYTAKKKNGDTSRKLRLQRVVTRTANVVVTVDYSGGHFDGGDLPSAKEIKKAAERVAAESVAAVNAAGEAAEAEEGEDPDDAGDSAGSKEPDETED